MIGITTSPRKISTLETTINSLIDSGISREKIILFDDSGPIKLGAWKNWYRGLEWLYNNTADEWLYLFQDDIIFSHNWNTYFEKASVPTDAAICSIFSPAKYKLGKEVGWYDVADRSLWCCQAFIIRRASAAEILKSRVVWSIRGDRQIDNRIGLWLEQSRNKIYYHSPSLVEHVGDESTLWEGAAASGWRKSRTFDAALDCLQLL